MGQRLFLGPGERGAGVAARSGDVNATRCRHGACGRNSYGVGIWPLWLTNPCPLPLVMSRIPDALNRASVGQRVSMTAVASALLLTYACGGTGGDQHGPSGNQSPAPAQATAMARGVVAALP